ncbi:hypothetical protein CK203_100113 [Vitis vinifera]|uniref:Uncharacterized protein n=1 Tax=Vitis vinifera TaxID=29760 RepID=A0A438C8I8_VITVI|nr:hypothetical protein CK203_100113 [Vitis vinifera]
MFGWMDECKQAFKEVERYLIDPPILRSPQLDEQLYMYLAVFDCEPSHPIESPKKGWWTLHVDEASRVSDFGVEYEVVLVGLDLALTLAATKLE